MNTMFKYISTILAQMSPDQKFKSLVILLLSISTIILTPTVLDTLSTNESEYKKILERCETRNKEQYKLIQDFQTEIDNLNIRIQVKSNECTRKILERDSYWTEQMKNIRYMVRNLSTSDAMIYNHDTIYINPSEDDLRAKNKTLRNIDELIRKNK